MSRDPYTTSDWVRERAEPIEQSATDATTVVAVGKALVSAVLLLAHAVADVADVQRHDPWKS